MSAAVNYSSTTFALPAPKSDRLIFRVLDVQLELCAGLTGEEIVRRVLAESQSDDYESPAAAQPTKAQLMQAVATLSSR